MVIDAKPLALLHRRGGLISLFNPTNRRASSRRGKSPRLLLEKEKYFYMKSGDKNEMFESRYLKQYLLPS
jgi:hypothetical protein